MARRNDQVQIIEAGLEELDLVAPLFAEYRVFYQQPYDLAGARAYIKERMEKKESVIFLAIEEDAAQLKPLGFVQLYPTFSSVSMKRLWVLNDLFVSPSESKKPYFFIHSFLLHSVHH